MRSLSGQASESLSGEFSPRQLQLNQEHQWGQITEEPPDQGEKRLEIKGKIYVDSREKGMARLLESKGLEITLKNLEVGDYVVSDRVAVERKTAQDFVASIIDPERNLFRQIADLSRSYERPILILEGRDLYTRQVGVNSILGALAAIAVDYGVPIIPTENQDDTASVISLLASREQKAGHEPKLHGHKTAER